MKDKGGRDGGGDGYEIGYKKPPKQTQFQKGQSGNSRGRPRAAKNTATLLKDALREKVVITENGARKSIQKREGVAKQLVNKAVGGNLKAISMLLAEVRLIENRPEAAAQSGAPQFEEEDLKVIEELNLQFGNGGKNSGGDGPEKI